MHARRPQTTIVLDRDSNVSETHGMREGSAYNGHYACTCLQPLFVFNQFGDPERCSLRPGNAHSAADWRDVLEPVAARYRNGMKRRYFPGGARIVRHGRSITFQMAGIMVSRDVFQQILDAVAALRPLPPARC